MKAGNLALGFCLRVSVSGIDLTEGSFSWELVFELVGMLFLTAQDRMRARAPRREVPSVARTFPAGPAGGPRGSEQTLQVRRPGHSSASQGPGGPPSSAILWVPRAPREAAPLTANGPRRRRQQRLRSPLWDKEKSFCLSPADGASAA